MVLIADYNDVPNNATCFLAVNFDNWPAAYSTSKSFTEVDMAWLCQKNFLRINCHYI